MKTGLPFREGPELHWIYPDQFSEKLVHVSDIVKPIWEVKAEPREFEIYVGVNGYIYSAYEPMPHTAVKIKVREVIED